MTLRFDSTDRQMLRLSLLDDGGQIQSTLEVASDSHDQVLLASIQQLLGQSGLVLSDLRQLEVNPGPGSFTGTRVGVAVGNSLALALAIPINGLAVGQWVNPKYARPANISLPSHS